LTSHDTLGAMKSRRIRKYIFVMGGVMSGVGKGVAASSIARLLKDSGHKVTAFKIDPYVNVDAGTMNPTEHGEVFVLPDGTECDQDMGNYERFLDRDLSGENYMTTGSIYRDVIEEERSLKYKGKCVEVIPHIPLAIIKKINHALDVEDADIGVIEIGGTVGEYQGFIFSEAARMLRQKKRGDVALVLVSYLPLLNKDNELKTKPTQYAVRTLNSGGLQPDIILARSALSLDKKRQEKIAFNCNMEKESIIAAPDVSNIYEIPINFKKAGLDSLLLKKLGLRVKKDTFSVWEKFVKKSQKAQKEVRVGVVGKYFSSGSFVLADSYVSVIEALKHAGFHLGARVKLEWLNAADFDPTEVGKEKARKNLSVLSGYDGIIVPGGFGTRSIEGKIAAIEYVRKKKIPFLGLCYGMQLAVVEFARHVLSFSDAHTTEVNENTSHPFVDILPEQKDVVSKERYGGTMRLGVYPAVVKKGTHAYQAYRSAERFHIPFVNRREYSKKDDLVISERHRHRYEINPEYLDLLEQKGLVISGLSPSGRLAEIIELPPKVHPFFVATQFHPELTSRPLSPHPLFVSFIKKVLS